MCHLFTVTQKQRLVELDADPEIYDQVFQTPEQRELLFKKLNRELAANNRDRLTRLRSETLRPAVRILESQLVDKLNESGFVEVTTPTTISSGMLAKMGIGKDHPLWEQVYWIGDRRCLRPMLAPNLYCLMERLAKTWSPPIRFFEVGQCFRKESKGARHLSEFTMLNLVEMGTDGEPVSRLREMAAMVMETAGLDYRLEVEDSEVYGDTIDVMVGDVEVASGAVGPHQLDSQWNIIDNWAGLGFGLERLVTVKEGFRNIRRAGRSLIYMDGARLNI